MSTVCSCLADFIKYPSVTFSHVFSGTRTTITATTARLIHQATHLGNALISKGVPGTIFQQRQVQYKIEYFSHGHDVVNYNKGEVAENVQSTV